MVVREGAAGVGPPGASTAAGGSHDVTLLKIGHHGSNTSTSEAFLRAITPEYGIIPVGARNRYGHPDPVVLARLRRAGVEVLRTDVHGTVSISARKNGSVVARRGR